MYPKKHPLKFYEASAESIIRYGLLVYGSSFKIAKRSNDTGQQIILGAIFLKESMTPFSKFIVLIA